MAWSTPATAVAGVVATAAWFNQYVRDNFKAIGDPWANYTPAYDGITIGNGTVVTKYIQAGKLVTGYVFITFGSTSTFSGSLRIGLPASPAIVGNQPLGAAFLYDTSAGAARSGVMITQSSKAIPICDGGTGQITPTLPWTWTTGDIISFPFTYEAA